MSVLSELTALFEQQVGVREKPLNNVIYNTHYYGSEVSGDAYPWCAAFIWDVFRMAGASWLFLDGGKSAYCPYIENWAKQHNQWVSAPPYRPGDLVLFDWGGDGVVDHIGFVLTWSGNSGTTVEGNASDAVCRMTRSAGQIKGAYRPNYPAESSPPVKESAKTDPAPTPTTASASTPGTYTVKQGDSLWAIAANLLGNGLKYEAIMEANGLTSASIKPGQVLRIPTESDRRTFSVTVAPETYRFLFDAATAQQCTVGQILDKLVEGKL